MLISFIRTVILYSILILVIRLMGKRQLGEMEPMEFVVTMLLANLAAVPMQETGIPLLASCCCPFWFTTACTREDCCAASRSF